jgi:hypothetical protein
MTQQIVAAARIAKMDGNNHTAQSAVDGIVTKVAMSIVQYVEAFAG